MSTAQVCFLCCWSQGVKHDACRGELLTWRLQGDVGGVYSRLTQSFGRIQVCVVAGLRSPFSWRQLGSSQRFKGTGCLVTVPIPHPHTRKPDLWILCNLSLPLARGSSLLLRGHGITQTIQNNLPILRFISLIPSVKFLSPTRLRIHRFQRLAYGYLGVSGGQEEGGGILPA